MMTHKTLAQIVAAKPYPDYAEWWAMGSDFVAYMAEAIGSQWRALMCRIRVIWLRLQRDVNSLH